MTDLSRETEEVLRRARLSKAMPVSKRRHIKAAVLARLAAGGIALTATEAAGAGFWASSIGAAVKGVASFALVASLGAGGYMAARPAKPVLLPAQAAMHQAQPRSDHAPPPSLPTPTVQSPRMSPQPHVAAATEPRSAERYTVAAAQPARAKTSRPLDAASKSKAPVDTASTSLPSALATATAPVTTASVVTSPVVAAPPAEPLQVSTLAEEARLLREADRALRAGKPEVAIALLDDSASRFPDGALAPERSGERLVALCQLGKADAASGARFLASHAGSALSARVRQACGAR